MSPTRRRKCHINSLVAYWDGQEVFGKREADILAHLRAVGPRTDREIMIGLRFTDMNSVRPRISELIDDGVLLDCGSQDDPITGKRVRIVKLVPRPGVQALFDLGPVLDTIQQRAS